MKKIYFIILGILVVILLAFFFWPRGGATPEAPNVANELPFGSSGEGLTPNLPSDFEGEIPRVEAGEDSGGMSVSTETKLFRLSSEPVAGFVVFNRATTTVARYVDRATGHIFEYSLLSATSSTALKRRLTNTTLPKIYEAHFRPDGSAVLMRSLEEGSDFVRNFIITLTAPRATSTDALYSAASTNLRGDIQNPTVRPDGSLLYIMGENSTLVSSGLDGSAPRTLASLGISGWKILQSQGATLIHNKASVKLSGYLYSVGTNGVLSKFFGPAYGLTASSNRSGTRVIYSYNNGVEMLTYALNRPANTVTEIFPATIAEKCLWSELRENLVFCAAPKGGLVGSQPDSWYQGRTQFSDYIWSYDTGTEIANLIVEPEGEFGLDLDVTNLKISSDERFLFFINKRDLSLWAIKLK